MAYVILSHLTPNQPTLAEITTCTPPSLFFNLCGIPVHLLFVLDLINNQYPFTF
jgi:hypothetical protein